MQFFIKFFFFSSINRIYNFSKYSNVIDIYLNKHLCYNLIIKKRFITALLKNKNKNKAIHIMYSLNNKFRKLLFSNILICFFKLSNNIFRVLKNKKIIYLSNKLKKCYIIL